MAAWIESHSQLREHPKLLDLCDALKITRAAAIGHLHMLWWWCMDYAQDGDLSRYRPAQVASAADWKGKPGPFVEALILAGWLDQTDDGGLHVHDWMEYGGKLLNAREKNAARMRSARAPNVQRTCTARAALEERTVQDSTVQGGCAPARAREAEPAAAASPPPSPNGANAILPAEETRQIDDDARLRANGCTDAEIAWARSECVARSIGYKPVAYVQRMIEGERQKASARNGARAPNDPTTRALAEYERKRQAANGGAA